MEESVWEFVEDKDGKVYAYNKKTQDVKIVAFQNPPDTAEFWKRCAVLFARELHGEYDDGEGDDDDE